VLGRNLPENLPTQTPIEVRFRYEENGLLTVTVKVEGADKALKHEIARENTLTAEELDAWRKYISGLGPAAEPKAASLGGEVKQALPVAKVLAEVVEFTPVEEIPSKPREKADRVPRK
jgi:molecular chaperone DnaK (HSP70)